MYNLVSHLFNQSHISNKLLNCLGISLAIVIISWSAICFPAQALLRQHHETPDVLRYHAQDSLKDHNGNTWQVLLFPDNTQGSTIFYLRLVGFPGVISFSHPQPLEIITSQGEVFDINDAYGSSAPAPNVGQYDLTSVIYRLSAMQSLKLSTSLLDDKVLSLKIPSEVLQEWQLLTQEIER
ncbi:MAG: DUF3122 domain-containing protein [Cyanobacteria bacterium J06623_7]